jgi:hypothetical protein
MKSAMKENPNLQSKGIIPKTERNYAEFLLKKKGGGDLKRKQRNWY